jgi:protochlorophyllide reductase
MGETDKVTMIDGKNFNGAKAYKDAKLCNMMTAFELHERYHESTGIVFSTMYPGCIAETDVSHSRVDALFYIYETFHPRTFSGK